MLSDNQPIAPPPRGQWPMSFRLAGHLVWFIVVGLAVLGLGVGLSDPRVQETLDPAPAVRPLLGHSIRRLQFSEDNQAVWITRLRNHVQAIDMATGEVLIHWELPSVMSPVPQISTDGLQLVYFDRAGQIIYERLNTPAGPRSLHHRLGTDINCFALNPRGNHIAMVSDTRLELKALSAVDQPSYIVDGNWMGCRLAWSPDGLQLFILHADGRLSLRDAYTGAELANVFSRVEAGWHAEWAPQGRFAFAYGDKGPIAIWDTLKPEAAPEHLDIESRSVVALSPNGQMIAVCDSNQQPWLINRQNLDDRLGLERLSTLASVASFTADGKFLLIGTLGGELHCWSIAEERWVWSHAHREA